MMAKIAPINAELVKWSPLAHQGRAVYLFPGKDRRVMLVEFPVDDAASPWAQALTQSGVSSGISVYSSPDLQQSLSRLKKKYAADKHLVDGVWPLSSLGLYSQGGVPLEDRTVATGSDTERREELSAPYSQTLVDASTYLVPDSTVVLADGTAQKRSLIEAHANVFTGAPYRQGRGAVANVTSGYSRGCAFITRLEYWDGVRYNDPVAGRYLLSEPFGQPLVDTRSLLQYLAQYTADHLREFNCQLGWTVCNLMQDTSDGLLVADKLELLKKEAPCLTVAEALSYMASVSRFATGRRG